MVQLTDVDGHPQAGGVSLSCLPQSYLGSLQQMPHTLLDVPTNQQSVPSQMYPQSTSPISLTTSSAEASSGTFADSPSGNPTFVSADMASIHAPALAAFGSLDAMPSTDLDSGLTVSNGFDSLKVSSDVVSDVSRTFEVIPVREDSSYSDGGDTLQSINHAVNCRQHFDSYIVDNHQQADSCILDNRKQTDSCIGNVLQQDTRVDSVDSLLESKGYASDCSSDVYMNSDYTDTITSIDSNTFLLKSSAITSNSNNTELERSEVSSSAEGSAPVAESGYSNEAYGADSNTPLIAWSSEESVKDEVKEVEAKKQNSDEWVITIPEQEDTGILADKEDDEEDGTEAVETAPLHTDCALENLVNHLAEQHPHEVVDITVQVLDGPVYESLTVPLQEDERSWLQSTDSLHHYKLLKQGRSTLVNSLRVQALSNLRDNTMNNLHERSSFLNLTAASVTNLGNVCQKALAHVRADMEFGSMMSLRDNLKHSSTFLAGRGQPPSDMEALSSEKKGKATVASGCHARNVVYMALLVTMLLISVNTTRNLQSSLNQEGGVGIICLAVTFASYMLGSLMSPLLVQGVGVKRCITSGLVLQLLYVAANLHPKLWLMLPASLGGGASLAVIWNAMSTYIVLLARGESNSKLKSYERVSDKFFGIFCLIYQSNLIVGNLVASLVLTFAGGAEDSASVLPVNVSTLNSTSTSLSAANLSDTHSAVPIDLSSLQEMSTEIVEIIAEGADNITPNILAFNASTDTHYHLCGSTYCHHFIIDQDSSAVPERTLFLLFGIFMFLVVVAMLIATCLLEPLSPHLFSSSSATTWHNVRHQFVSMVKFSRNIKFLLLLPMMLYSSMQFSFVCSEVMMVSTQAHICLYVHTHTHKRVRTHTHTLTDRKQMYDVQHVVN